jgi:glycosyltransferase involved in cell wall biosynthesis
LDVYGIGQGETGAIYQKDLENLAAGDPRISFLPPVARETIIDLLKKYHLLAVPSQGLETGPLVILEAFAAGTPVLGSNLGGIAELVHHDVDGILVDPTSVEAWAAAIQRCTTELSLLASLRRGIFPPRSMETVAEEMQGIYEHVLTACVHTTENLLPVKESTYARG